MRSGVFVSYDKQGIFDRIRTLSKSVLNVGQITIKFVDFTELGKGEGKERANKCVEQEDTAEWRANPTTQTRKRGK